MNVVLQVLIILFAPYLWMRLSRKWQVESWLSPVVLSYLTGIVLANIPIIHLNHNVSETFVQGSIVLAIPLLLYSTDLLGWFKYAGKSVLSFFLCVISGVLSSVLTAILLKDVIENSWLIAGMLVGVYTGGTPNMNAIGIALEAQNETIVLMNASDILCGGIYLIFLTSVAHKVFSKVLPAFKGDRQLSKQLESVENSFSVKSLFLLFGLTLLVIAFSLGFCYLFFGNIDQLAFILLMLTTLSIGLSMLPGIRSIQGSFEIGEYLLLMFCVAIGMEAVFTSFLEEGSSLLLFMAIVLGGTIMVHLILARIFKVDVETFMITSTAAIYGPVFIGQIASTIKNKTLIVSGMATGLVGYAIGNYLGISVAHLLKNFF